MIPVTLVTIASSSVSGYRWRKTAWCLGEAAEAGNWRSTTDWCGTAAAAGRVGNQRCGSIVRHRFLECSAFGDIGEECSLRRYACQCCPRELSLLLPNLLCLERAAMATLLRLVVEVAAAEEDRPFPEEEGEEEGVEVASSD